MPRGPGGCGGEEGEDGGGGGGCCAKWGVGCAPNAGLLPPLLLRLRSDRYRHTRRPHLPERGHNKTKAQKTRRAAATDGPWAGLRERNEDHMIGNHTGQAAGQKAGRSRRCSRLMFGSTRCAPDKAARGDSLVLRGRRGTPHSVGSPGLRDGFPEERLRVGGDGFEPGYWAPLRCRDPGFLWVRLAASFVNSRCRGGKQEEPRGEESNDGDRGGRSE